MQYLDIGLNVIASVFSWYASLDLHFKFLTPVMALFTIGCVYRFLIQPLLGRSAGSSDTVKKERRK